MMCPTVNEMEFHLPAPQSSSIPPPPPSCLIHDCSRSVKHSQLPSVVISSAFCESHLLKVPLLSNTSHTCRPGSQLSKCRRSICVPDLI